jgi:predicted RNase H-like HicB family nuclease
VGKTREEVETLIREAIEFHLEGMVEDGDPIPEPTCVAIDVEVNVPVRV